MDYGTAGTYALCPSPCYKKVTAQPEGIFNSVKMSGQELETRMLIGSSMPIFMR